MPQLLFKSSKSFSLNHTCSGGFRYLSWGVGGDKKQHQGNVDLHLWLVDAKRLRRLPAQTNVIQGGADRPVWCKERSTLICKPFQLDHSDSSPSQNLLICIQISQTDSPRAQAAIQGKLKSKEKKNPSTQQWDYKINPRVTAFCVSVSTTIPTWADLHANERLVWSVKWNKCVESISLSRKIFLTFHLHLQCNVLNKTLFTLFRWTAVFFLFFTFLAHYSHQTVFFFIVIF